MNDAIRAAWWRVQGLDGALRGRSAEEVLGRTGWMRSVGGSGPYLGLRARCGASREAIDREVAEVRICELPSARGCTYVVPASDFAVALRAAQGKGDEATVAMAKKHLGVTDEEVERLCAEVLDALGDATLDPRDLKEALGGAVRHLGEAGKKRGTTTTLPLALGRLQSHGLLRRVPVNGRLDQQRYGYRAWSPSPLAGVTMTDDELAVELGRRFFTWVGVGTADQLAWWAGLSKKAAKQATAELGLVPFAGRLATPAFVDLASAPVPREPDVRLVGSLDNLFHLRRDVAALLDDAGGGATVSAAGPTDRGGVRPVSTLLDLPHHAILDRGRLVGVWDFDVAAGEVVARAWEPVEGLGAAVAEATRFVRDELGDARAFGLDGPASRGERLAALRAG